jgi:alanine racemase
VGYGTVYQAQRDEILASVPVGYYQGFPRQLSNLGHVLVNGRRAPVVGLVNMNMMMVDVTECNTAGPGDEVTIIGAQRRSRVTVSSFSDLSSLVNYEVLVRIPSTIPRVVVP